MKSPKRRFVVSLSRSNSDLEQIFWTHHQKHPLAVPSKAELAELAGVRFSKGKTIIDCRNPRSSQTLRIFEIMSHGINHPLTVARLNAERIGIVKQLAALGYRVAVPNYPEVQSEKLISRIRNHAKVFRARIPGRATSKFTDEKMEIDSSIFWTRDLWKKIGGKRFKRYLPEHEDPVGEEGKSVTLPNKVILAHDSIRDSPSIKALRAQGYHFYFMGDGEVYSPRLSKFLKTLVFEMNDHLDLQIGCVGKVLLVNQTFFFQNKAVIEKAARNAGCEIVFVPKEDENLHAANFLVLEPGKALVDRDAKKTIALLRQKRITVIPTAISLHVTRESGANVRCMVNEL